MSRTKKPGARTWLVTAVAAAVAATAVAITQASDDADLTSEEAASAGAAALRAVGSGEVVAVERSSDEDDVAWTVDVIQGSQVIEVSLDDRHRPLRSSAQPIDGRSADSRLAAIAEQFEYRRGVREELREDRQLPRPKRKRAAAAARRAAGGGEVVYVEKSENPGEAYEVDVTKGSRDVEVFLNRRFEVVRRERFR